MANRYAYSFQPINSTAPAFNSSAGSSAVYALEATGREWQYPTSRAVRITSKAADDFSILFGNSAVAPSTATSMLVLGGVSEVFTVETLHTHIGIASSTDVIVNVTLGTGA